MIFYIMSPKPFLEWCSLPGSCFCPQEARLTQLNHQVVWTLLFQVKWHRPHLKIFLSAMRYIYIYMLYTIFQIVFSGFVAEPSVFHPAWLQRDRRGQFCQSHPRRLMGSLWFSSLKVGRTSQQTNRGPTIFFDSFFFISLEWQTLKHPHKTGGDPKRLTAAQQPWNRRVVVV